MFVMSCEVGVSQVHISQDTRTNCLTAGTQLTLFPCAGKELPILENPRSDHMWFFGSRMADDMFVNPSCVSPSTPPKQMASVLKCHGKMWYNLLCQSSPYQISPLPNFPPSSISTREVTFRYPHPPVSFPTPCRSPGGGGWGTVTWSTQNFSLRLIVLLCGWALPLASLAFMAGQFAHFR